MPKTSTCGSTARTDNWLRECEQAWPGAVPQLLSVLHAPCLGAIYQSLFATPPDGDDEAMPKRFGYYAGWRIVHPVVTDMSAPDRLSVDISAAQKLVRKCLEPR